MRTLLLLPLALFAAACSDEAASCSADADCAADEGCTDGACVPRPADGTCATNDDCAEGEACVNRACVEVEPIPNPLTCPEAGLAETLVCSDWDPQSCPCFAGEVSFREKEEGGRMTCAGVVGIFQPREGLVQTGCHFDAPSGALEGELVGFAEASIRVAQLPNSTTCATVPELFTEGAGDPGVPSVKFTCSATCTFWMIQHRAPAPEELVLDGQFALGTPADRATPLGVDEQPSHLVDLTCFSIDRGEVTRGAFKECFDAGACEGPELSAAGGDRAAFCSAGSAELPMTFVNHRTAAQYCAFHGRSLPTEAEWERAARSDPETYANWPWGDAPPFGPDGAPDCARANFAGCGDAPRMVPEGEAGASGAHVLDMAGNVREWTRDFYRADVYASHGELVPRNPEQTSPDGGLRARVVRGGSFRSAADAGATPASDELRVSDRDSLDEASVADDLGFRCVRYKPGVPR